MYAMRVTHNNRREYLRRKVNRKQIRQDQWLRRMRWIGIPLFIVSILSLWAGQWLANSLLGQIFIVTMPVVLVIGFIYNIRFVMIAVALQKKEADTASSSKK